MASFHGTNALLDLSYTYNKTDLRSTQNPKNLIAASNSILGKLQSNGQFKYFLYILKNSGLSAKLGACKAKFTLFAVPDQYLKEQFCEDFFLNIDHYDALKIIRNHTAENYLTLNDIKTEEASTITNLVNHHGLYTMVKGDDIYVEDAKVIDSENCVNGNIIVIDKLLLPYYM